MKGLVHKNLKLISLYTEQSEKIDYLNVFRTVYFTVLLFAFTFIVKKIYILYLMYTCLCSLVLPQKKLNCRKAFYKTKYLKKYVPNV